MRSLPFALAACLAAAAHSQSLKLPAGFSAPAVATGLSRPVGLAIAPDGRIFVCEKAGRLRVIKDGKLLAAPFKTLPVLLRGSEAGSECGLLGVAVGPRFADTPYVYVFHTLPEPQASNRITRFLAQGDTAAPGSETVILDFGPSGGWNHNGGAIHFGPDGMLYASHGDAARGGNIAHDLTTLLGKIIRMKPAPAATPEAQVPADNPFAATAAGKNRLIWAYGLRNPFSFAFQPGTGRMFINDVGQGTYEEINEGKAGADYGWEATEGPFAAGSHPGFTAPIFAFGRTTATANQGTRGDCIVGAAFYNPPQANFPAEYVGKYFFGDFPYESWIRYLDPEHPELGAKTFAENTDHAALAVAPDGAMYYTDHTAGVVRKIAYGGGTGIARRASARLEMDFASGLRLRLPDGRFADPRGRAFSAK